MIENKWKTVEINSICRIRRGASPRPIHDYIRTSGIPWLKIADVTSSTARYVYKTKEFIKEEGRKKSRFLKSGSLVLSNSATPGIPKILGLDACVHDGWLILDKFKDITQDYLYYLLLNERESLLRLSNGSVFRNLKTDIVKKYVVKIPNVKEQKAIAHILSTLDDKIEVNNCINKVLENIAQTIFKRWFVDFEFPCLPDEYKSAAENTNKSDELLSKMKNVCTYRKVGGMPVPEDGKWFVYVLLCEDDSFYISVTDDLYYSFYKHYVGEGDEYTKNIKPVRIVHYEEFSSKEEAVIREEELKTEENLKWLETEYEKLRAFEEGETDLEKADSGLVYAGEMIFNELELIPKQWIWHKLEERLNFLRGVEPGSKNYKTERISNKYLPFIRVGDLLNKSDIYVNKDLLKGRLVSNDDIIVSFDGAIGRVGIGFKGGYSSGIRKIYSKGKNYSNPYIYLLFKSKKIQDQINKYANGTTILHAGAAISHLYTPYNEKIYKMFEGFVEPIFYYILKRINENKKLIFLRDILLPKLMSGELRVPIDDENDGE